MLKYKLVAVFCPVLQCKAGHLLIWHRIARACDMFPATVGNADTHRDFSACVCVSLYLCLFVNLAVAVLSCFAVLNGGR